MAISQRALVAYYRALGEFVTAFALVESSLHHMLRAYAGVDYEIGGAVFAGLHINNVRDMIARLREARSIPKDDDFDRVMAQFGLISSTRNDILHFGALSSDKGGLVVTNAMRVL